MPSRRALYTCAIFCAVVEWDSAMRIRQGACNTMRCHILLLIERSRWYCADYILLKIQWIIIVFRLVPWISPHQRFSFRSSPVTLPLLPLMLTCQVPRTISLAKRKWCRSLGHPALHAKQFVKVCPEDSKTSITDVRIRVSTPGCELGPTPFPELESLDLGNARWVRSVQYELEVFIELLPPFSIGDVANKPVSWLLVPWLRSTPPSGLLLIPHISQIEVAHVDDELFEIRNQEQGFGDWRRVCFLHKIRQCSTGREANLLCLCDRNWKQGSPDLWR